jgi:hypothetical protein
MRADRELAPDIAPRESALREIGKETTRESKELTGYTLQATVHTGDPPPGSKGPEVAAAAIEAARKKTEARLTIDFSPSRARFVVGSGFVLPAETELRARVDRYGHVLLWPGDGTYRVAAPGTLRALVGERRLDVAPLASADVVQSGEGARRLNVHTRKVDVTTRAAKATFEIAAFKGAGDGGTLVCRALLDLMNAPPSTPMCATDEVPLHAELRWTTRGALLFDVVSITQRADISAQQLAAPPASVAFSTAPPPLPPAEVLLTRGELAALRSAPVDVPPLPGRDAQAPAPESGLLLVNSSDELRVVWLDGVPVAWLAPGAREPLPSLVRGRYSLQWRTFLGDALDAPETVAAPGQSEIGVSDAGAAP